MGAHRKDKENQKQARQDRQDRKGFILGIRRSGGQSATALAKT